MSFKIVIKSDGQVLFMYCDPLRNKVGTKFERITDDNRREPSKSEGRLSQVAVCKNYIKMFQGP